MRHITGIFRQELVPLIRKPEKGVAANMDMVMDTMSIMQKAKANTTKGFRIKTVYAG